MPSSPPHVLRSRWLPALQARVRTLLLAKMLGTTLGISGFFVAYFWILSTPRDDVTMMPLLALDGWIGLRPQALWLYLSLWLYVSIGPALIGTRRELLSYAWCALLLSVLGLGIFALWPTSMPPTPIDWSRYPELAFIKQVDAARNACPSMHVAFAVFTAVWMERMLRQMQARAWLQSLNVAWALAILYSTVATRQHVVLDVLAGALLGAAVAGLNMHWLQRMPRAVMAVPQTTFLP